MKIDIDDPRFRAMAENRRELIALLKGLGLSQNGMARLVGVRSDIVNLWVRPERKGTVEPPSYAIATARAYSLLSHESRCRLLENTPVVNVDDTLKNLGGVLINSESQLAFLNATGRELGALMALCRVNQSALSRLIGVHSVTVNRWLRPHREDAKVAPLYALNFMRAFYLLREDKRLKLNSPAPLIDVDAALRGEGITFVR